MNTPNKIARTAGALYFLYILTSIIADIFGNFVFADPPTTVQHILAHESSFRVGIVISAFSVVFFLLAAWALYVLLKPIDRNKALLILIFNAAGFGVWCLMMVDLFAGQLLLSGADYLKVFQPEQLQAAALFFVYLFKKGYVFAQIPYGFWLLPLGYLVYKSNFLPKFLGILLLADFVGLQVYVLQRLVFPGFELISYACMVLGFIAETTLTLWLLIKGVKEQG